MAQANESDLNAPLLDADDAIMESQNNGNNDGGVTLNGETLDVRDLFPAGVNNTRDGNDNATDERSEALSPTSTLSLDQQTANNTSPTPSKMDYVKQTLLFLPKKGRSVYHRTRYSVVNYIQTKRSGDGGLTPVESSAASSTNNNDEASSSHLNTSNIIPRNNSNNNKSRRRNQLTQKSSLFRSPTTPLLLKYLLPPLLIMNHVLFYHAQTLPMWNLAYKTDISVSATASTLKAKAAADALNVPHHYEFVNKEETVVETFTYMDAIRKLWEGEGLGDAKTVSKVAAALLVVFSGIWPHWKLLMMQLCWFVPFVHGLWINDGRDDDDDDDDENESNKCCGVKRCCTKNNGSCNNRSSSKSSRCNLCCSNGHSHETHTLRSPFLRTLSTLGKWSLADVLVVCILIAVLHLDWEVDPDAIRNGIEAELPTLLEYANQKYPDEVSDCARLLGYTCGRHALVIHFPACLTCQTLIKNAYHHPGWTTSEGVDILEGVTLEGGGYAQLRVMGMIGTYYFCGAVLMSILLSLVVDWLDERDRGSVEEDLLDRKRELEFILPGNNGGGGGGNELELREESSLPPLNEAFLSDDDPIASQSMNRESGLSPVGTATSYARLDRNASIRTLIPSPSTNCRLLKQAMLILLSVSSLPLVCFAVTLPTMQRLVYGGGPTLLHEVLGMVWEKEYSLITLVKTTGDAGGWDKFLMLTFGLFAVVGPIVRSVCLILHVFLGLPVALLGDCMERPRKRTTLRMVLYQVVSTLRRGLLPIIDALGAFCCWEVLIVALIMIQLEMPSITDTIYQDDRCQELDPDHGRTCIEVQFNACDNFYVVCIAWVVLILSSGLAMDLAVESDEKLHNGAGQEEKRYEFGQPIPQRRSNLNRDRAWMVGSSKTKSNARDVGNDGDEEEYFSPLEGGGDGGGQNPLEQIVFL